jgi:hypothetical protein
MLPETSTEKSQQVREEREREEAHFEYSFEI